MKGKRVANDLEPHLYEPGAGLSPNGHHANLGAHVVVEHEDGSITVSPSIGINDGRGQVYHGFLERGVWRDA